MPSPIRTLVHDFRWIHLAVGLSGNTLFFVGSIMFLPTFEPWKTLAVWMFIVGSALMLLGSLGELLKQTLAPNE
ncbi:MAG: YrhK family protein [Novosphingobium sp.]